MNQLSFSFMENYVDEGIKLNKLGKFKTKKCIKCQKDYEATLENFAKSATNKDKCSSYCRTCNNLITSSKQEQRKLNKKCLHCNREKLPNHSCCAYHACYGLISNQQQFNRFQNVKRQTKKQLIEALLLKLENQNHKCAITGESIEFGLNISLDHIVSIKQGGTDDLENLQWVTLKANKEKGAFN